MTDTLLGMQLGTWADWAAAVASILAAVLSIVSISLAREANRAARRALEQDDLRERAEVARQLQAWWAKRRTEAGDENGLVVVNSGDGAAVFHDVVIQAVVDGRGKGEPVRFETLPPGTFFVASRHHDATVPRDWSRIPEPLSSPAGLVPLTFAKKWAVTAMTFTDPVGITWRWSREKSLEKVEG